MKTCVKCSTKKIKSSFHRDKRRADGLYPYCRTCRGCKKDSPHSAKQITGHSNGYVQVLSPDHPLANSTGYVYEHRKILFDLIGYGDHSCAICGKYWNWRTYKDHVDHINEDRENNTPENLRPLCNSCNSRRTRKPEHECKGRYSIKWQGEAKTPTEWARDERCKVNGSTINRRIKRGWSAENAITTPSKTFKGKC